MSGREHPTASALAREALDADPLLAIATSSLRVTLEDAAAQAGCSLKDLTVLSPQVDPFRLDTPINHRNGKWLAESALTLGILTDDRMIHLRGLHYAIALAADPFIKPNGTRYLNDDEDWLWLSEEAAKAARWLGYIGFDQIFDRRNATPIVRIFRPSTPRPYLLAGAHVHLPEAEEIVPRVGILDFDGVQPYKLVMIGEKASLDEGLSPIAARYEADLYLPTGNISDTLVHQIAKIGAEDGRPMVVLYFSDCDPSGWNMPIEVGRKLQAFKATLYPDLDFRQYRALLTPDQVRRHNLPSGPLKAHKTKPGEYADKRSDKWIEAMGVEQTEVDVLTMPSTLGLLRQIAEAAIAPFYDHTLRGRVRTVMNQWINDAQTEVDANIDQERLVRLREQFGNKLAELRTEIDAVNKALQIDADDFDLPDVPSIPAPVINDAQPYPLVDSRWSFADQCRALIDSKNYEADQ